MDKFILNESVKWKEDCYAGNKLFVLMFCNNDEELEELGCIWFNEESKEWCCTYSEDVWDILKAKTLKGAKTEYIKKLSKHYNKQIFIYKNLIKDLSKSKEEE